MTDYLTVADVIGLHAAALRAYGGASGLRDAGALESAVFRPQTGYYSDVIHEAAALMESLAMNRPFVDGNKRVAFAATDVFLRINGFRLNTDSDTIYRFMIGLFEAHRFEIKEIEPFLRMHTRQLITD